MRLAREYADASGGVVAMMQDLNLSAMFADRMAPLVEGCLTALGRLSDVLTAHHLTCAHGCLTHVNHVPESGPSIVPQAVA